MLIVDVLKTVGDLASAINRKTRELDALKEEYAAKLALVNQHAENLSQLSEKDYLDLLQSKIECPQCHTVVHDNAASNFVLVPKGKVSVPRAPRPALEPAPPPLPKSTKRKTCSYCHERGHSRAQCAVRLATPKPT